MKKIYLIILLTISSLTFGQNNCDELKAENENLKRQIYEMKKILLITTSIKEVQVGDINVKLMNITGDIRTQTVQIEMLFTNTGINADGFTTKIKSIISAGGSEVVLENAQIGSKSGSSYLPSSELYRNTPLKCIYTFKGVVPETFIIKAFPVPFQYSKQGTRTTTKEEILFNDLTINWK